MHFLGLAGMPRRIPDFPDAYENLNTLCSLGSLITVASLAVFLVIIDDVVYYKNIKNKLGIFI